MRLLLFSRIGHLMEDTDGHMSRSDLEKALCYSGNYMNTIVNKYTEMCFYDYGLTFTMKKAAHLLAETDLTISAIETRLGLTNRTHFYKLFRERYGVTPGEYRKRDLMRRQRQRWERMTGFGCIRWMRLWGTKWRNFLKNEEKTG